MAGSTLSAYKLELPPPQKRVFVTQLQDEEDEEDDVLDIRKIPIVKEKADKLIEIGFNTMQSTLLLKREANMHEVDREYRQKQQEFNQRIEEIEKRKDAIDKKTKTLKKRTEKFKTYIEENDANKKRALQKYHKELKQNKQKIHERECLQKKLKNLLDRSALIKEKLNKYQIYETYLLSVVDSLPGDYIETADDMVEGLMKRYETLYRTYEKLLKKQNDLQIQLQVETSTFQRLSYEHANNLMCINQELSFLQDKLEDLSIRNSKLETSADRSKQVYLEDSEIEASITLAVHNIADKCVGRKNRLNIESFTLIQKLDLILPYIQERLEIIEMVKPQKETKVVRFTHKGRKEKVTNKLRFINSKEPI